jgi:hypothetical protein
MMNEYEAIVLSETLVHFEHFTTYELNKNIIQLCRGAKKYITCLPKDKQWEAWEEWSLGTPYDTVEGISFLKRTGWIDSWAILSYISMEDDYMFEMNNMLATYFPRDDDNDKVAIRRFATLLWNAGNAYVKNPASKKEILDVQMAGYEQSMRFMTSIGAPSNIAKETSGIVKWSTWNLTPDINIMEDIAKDISRQSFITLITMFRNSFRSTKFGGLPEIYRVLSGLYAKPTKLLEVDKKSLVPTKAYLKAYGFEECYIETLQKKIDSMIESGEISSLEDALDFVSDEFNNMVV